MKTQQRKPYKRMTEQELKRIRGMVEIGLTIGDIMRITSRSRGVIHAAAITKTTEEYKKEIKKYLPGKEKPEQVNDERPSYHLVPDDTRSVIAVLEKISSTLERLAEAWERKPDYR